MSRPMRCVQNLESLVLDVRCSTLSPAQRPSACDLRTAIFLMRLPWIHPCLVGEAGHFPGMNALLPAAVVLGFLPSLTLTAQVIPATPKKFDTGRIGDAASGGSTVNVAPPRTQTTVRTVTHIVIGEPRQWKMMDGKSFIGKLIAFEDIVLVGNTAAAPAVPKNPTIVRDGKARVLVDSKPFEIALDRLGAEERKFIEDTRTVIAAKK